MSATHTILGAGLVVATLQMAWSVIGPSPEPIEVHSLTYEAGFIIQDRTVSTDGPWLAVWAAEILDIKTGKPVDGCEGTGVWPYPPGHITAPIPIAEWVGNASCRLAPGTYQPVATYAAGEFRKVVRGTVFEVKE